DRIGDRDPWRRHARIVRRERAQRRLAEPHRTRELHEPAARGLVGNLVGPTPRPEASRTWHCRPRSSCIVPDMSTTHSLDKLLADSGLAETAHALGTNLVRLQWGSAFVLVGISGSAIVAIAPLFRAPPHGKEP